MTISDQGKVILSRIAALPDGVWQACRSCRSVLHIDRVKRQLGVCPECGHRDRLTARDRITHLVDEDTFQERDADLTAGDPLSFVDKMPYPERLDKARAATGLNEGVVSGVARMGGNPVVLAVFDFNFLGGSMGSIVGEKIVRAAELAMARDIPLITVASSGGARMQEGILSLLQMARTSAAIQRMREAGVPFISVLTDPVYGGVAASFAALGDVIVAEAGTRAGFAGPQVIQQTIRQTLPKGFQTAEFLHQNGHIDLVVERTELPGVLRQIVSFCTAVRAMPNPHTPAASKPTKPKLVPPREAVRLARVTSRPNALEYFERVFTGFLPLHGDRWSADDAAVVGGLAWLDDTPVMVVGHCKGRDTADNVRRNFGMPQPSGYRKAMRLFSLADRLGIPVVTLVDTPGAYPGIDAERANQSGAIAEALALCASLGVPLVSVVTGEGGSGGALALATGDRLLMQENTVYSVISPEGCATILFGDAGRAGEAAEALRLRAADLIRLGVADELVPEPEGGAHTDPQAAADAIGAAVRRHLIELLALPREELLRQRYERLRGFGDRSADRFAGDDESLAAQLPPVAEMENLYA